MSKYDGALLGMMVENFRNNGTINIESAKEVVKSLAQTNLSTQEIATSFQENLIDATPLGELTNGDADAVV